MQVFKICKKKIQTNNIVVKTIKYLYLKKDFNRNGDAVKLKTRTDTLVCHHYVHVTADYVFVWTCAFNNFLVVLSDISCNQSFNIR